MGLDITFRQKRKIICPKCGEVVDYKTVEATDSGGRAWYPFLEAIGYYPDTNDWYGKDMMLTNEQAQRAYDFARDEEVYNWSEVIGLIAVALCEKDEIAINANW